MPTPGGPATTIAGSGPMTPTRLAAVADGVRVARSRRYATTSTMIVSGDRAVLVDPAWDPDELAHLVSDTADLGVRVEAGLATHWHYDHLLWHPGFGDVPRWASAGTVRQIDRHRHELDQAFGEWPSDLAPLCGRVQALDGTTVPWSGPEVELVVHDAHALGHTAAWVPEFGVLVAGDMLSDVELPLPDDDPGLERYRAGLAVLAPYVSRATILVPGHGAPKGRPVERLDADRRYLDAVSAGLVPDDDRMADPAMADAHAATVALARADR